MKDNLAGHKVRDPRALGTKVEIQLDQAADELARRVDSRIGYDRVRVIVEDAYQRLAAQARVTNFLPILAARAAHRTLTTP